MNNNMEISKKSDCSKCQYGYEVDIACFEEDWHSYCGLGHCYLCEQVHGNRCEDYSEGDIPAGKERF